VVLVARIWIVPEDVTEVGPVSILDAFDDDVGNVEEEVAPLESVILGCVVFQTAHESDRIVVIGDVDVSDAFFDLINPALDGELTLDVALHNATLSSGGRNLVVECTERCHRIDDCGGGPRGDSQMWESLPEPGRQGSGIATTNDNNLATRVCISNMQHKGGDIGKSLFAGEVAHL
jgi:hypothetical protein